MDLVFEEAGDTARNTFKSETEPTADPAGGRPARLVSLPVWSPA
jgi:hypothetical protein